MFTRPNPDGRFDIGARPRTHRRLRPASMRIVAVTATMLCGITGVVVAGSAFADDSPRRGPGRPGGGQGGGPGNSAGAPANLTPPGNVVPVTQARVVQGVQIYTCTGGTFAPAATPEADLRGRSSIHHFGGPSWQSNTDGSLVTATKTAESAVAGAVAELLLTVNSHSGDPNGELAKVTHIQRLGTKGGVAPTGACTDGEKAPVPYQATYIFFAPR